jgi:tRNA(fMet)-specific endonuclease VapC
MFLLDTDTCVFWLRGRVSVRDRVAAAGQESLRLSAITLAELRYGAALAAQPEANQQAIDNFVSDLVVPDVTEAVARTFGDIKAELRRRGSPIEDCDLFIGATAHTYDLTLVTSNTAHFRRIPQLRLEDWGQPR